MKRLLRAAVLALVLVFGVPAAALLLARLGMMRMPRDAYLSSVTELSPPTSVEDRTHVLPRLDPVGSARTIIARAAIVEAAAHLPGHRDGVARDWTVHRLSHTGFTYGRMTEALSSTRIACDDCGGTREARLLVFARVVSRSAERAEVAVHWSIAPERRRFPDRSGPPFGIPPSARGKLSVTLERADGAWRAVQIERDP